MDKAKEIIVRYPINKLARIVTDQKGCSSGILTDEQLRQNLITRLHSLQNAAKKLNKKKHAIGEQIVEVQKQITELRPPKKAPGVERYFIDAAREVLTHEMFRMVMSKAVELKNNDEE